MNVRQVTRVVVVAASLAGFTGCATTGGNQVESAVYDTHRMVKGLDTSLQPSVEQLNQTAADMGARLTTTEEQTRRLQAMLEENQVRLDSIQRKLDELNRMVAVATGVTPPSDSSMAPSPGVAPSPRTGTEGVTMGPPTAPNDMSMPTTPVEPDRTLEPMPSTPAAPSSGNATTDYQVALDSYRAGSYDAAIQQFDTYIKRYPDSQYAGNSQYWKALSYARLKKYEDAVREFEKLRALYPTNKNIPLAMYNQAAALSNLGRIPETEALLEKLIQDYPNDAAAATAREDLKKIRGN